jgi:MFS family permease
VLKWFVRNRGKALSFMGLGIPIGAMIFVPLTQVFIDAWGWRTTWLVLAIIGMVVIVPLAGVFVRRQPEDMGLLPDGVVPTKTPQAAGQSDPLNLPTERSWSTREAMGTPTLWRLVIVFSMVSLAVGIVGVHRIPAFMDRGMDPTLISLATALDAVCAGLATFTFGMLVRKVPAKILGATGFLLLAVASVLTIYATDIPLMALSMAVFGLGIGGMIFLQNFVWADYFGRGHVGSIRGLVTPINLMVGGVGAPIAGYVRDATGTYNNVWWAGVALMILAALLLAFTNRPASESSASARSNQPGNKDNLSPGKA